MIRKGDNSDPCGFPDTPNTLIDQLRAHQGDAEAEVELLREFLGHYTLPIRSYIRHFFDSVPTTHSPEDVDDALQSFLKDKLVARNIAAEAWKGPESGRFRNYLMTSIRLFLISRYRDQMREPEACSISELSAEELAELASRPTAGHTPSERFDVAWARSVVTRGIVRAQEHLRESGREHVWEAFNLFRLQPALGIAQCEPGESPTIVEIAQKMGVVPKQVSNWIVTANRAVQRYTLATVLEYAPQSGVDEEIGYILKLLDSRIELGDVSSDEQ